MTGIQAVFFDQDGVIIDTERDGHRVAFNRAFEEFGFAVSWDVETYRGLLAIAGGKERLAHYLHTRGFGQPVPADEAEALIRRLHERKTAIFVELIEGGSLPLRPGVRRLMSEIVAAGLALGICTTSNERAARAITEKLLSEFPFDVVLAGDVVKKKKPAPEIYLLALARTNLAADQCIVIEDSANGIEAAARAGIRTVATSNAYTEREDLGKAGIIVSCLGEPGGELGRLIKPDQLAGYDGVLRLQQIVDCLSSPGRSTPDRR